MATTASQPAGRARSAGLAGRALTLPPASFFVVSAIFHYLGPALAVLLFAHVTALGVMWLRVAAAAVVFAVWRRPWRLAARLDRRQRGTLLALGIVLAAMNALFYLAIARLPLATVGAIEFLGTVVLAALGARTRRNLAALVLTVAGVAALTAVQVAAQPLGFVFAFGNCAGFMLYVVLGHRVANTRVAGAGTLAAIDQLGAAMLIGAVAATPLGLGAALPAVAHPAWLPRATFALMLALLPAFAAITGAVVLGQVPTARELAGIGLVILGVALHRADPADASAKGRARAPGSAAPPSRAAPGARRSAGGTAEPRRPRPRRARPRR